MFRSIHSIFSGMYILSDHKFWEDLYFFKCDSYKYKDLYFFNCDSDVH